VADVVAADGHRYDALRAVQHLDLGRRAALAVGEYVRGRRAGIGDVDQSQIALPGDEMRIVARRPARRPGRTRGAGPDARAGSHRTAQCDVSFHRPADLIICWADFIRWAAFICWEMKPAPRSAAGSAPHGGPDSRQ